MEKKRINAIDGMKGINALIIACVYHLATVPFEYLNGIPGGNIKPLGWIYQNGYIFVESFFLCSGYLAFWHYTSQIEKGMSFESFMQRRIVRIFPLMWATLFTAVAGELLYYNLHAKSFWFSGGNTANSIYTLFLNILGLQTFFPLGNSWNYPAWTLSVFFICWGIYYLITNRCKTDRGRIYACAGMVILGITLQNNLTFLAIPFLNGAAARGYISFFMGGLVFYLNRHLNEKKRHMAGWFSFCWLLVCIMLYMNGITCEPFQTTMSIAVWPFVILTILNIPVLNKIMSLKPFLLLGKISFSIYLCNYSVEIFTVILNEAFNWNIDFSSGLFFFGNIVVQIGIASLFYYFFEKRLSQIWKNALNGKKEQKAENC